jgi:hypothetical protein
MSFDLLVFVNDVTPASGTFHHLHDHLHDALVLHQFP